MTASVQMMWSPHMYELYLKSKSQFAEAGFKLRKFVTNIIIKKSYAAE